MLYLTEVCDGVKYVDFERNITVKSFRVSFAYEYILPVYVYSCNIIGHLQKELKLNYSF